MNIQFPNSATRFILYQRSQHLRFTRTRLYRWMRSMTGAQAIRPISFVESRLRKRAIQRAYQEEIAREFEMLAPHLPADCNHILDIGCGIGVINLFFHQHYGAESSIDFYLLDRSAVAKGLGYGFKTEGEFYNSLELTKNILSSNGINESRIHLLEIPCVLTKEIPHRVDLVISLISWGFHYPIETYLEEVTQLMGPRGRLILDVRSGTDGLVRLRERFGEVQTIFEDKKRTRLVASSPQA